MNENLKRVFLHAPNVHQGGGKSLLTALLNSFPDDWKVFTQLDTRMTLSSNLPENLSVKFVKPSILQRLRAEWWLAQNVLPQDDVLCFGNLPPLFKLQGRVTVFVQNRYLVDKVSLRNFSFRDRLRLSLERIWLSTKMCNADEFVVQTPSMKILLNSEFGADIQVHVKPFVNLKEGYARSLRQNDFHQCLSRWNFLYVASGDSHKNHCRLVEAWCLLAKENLFPSLYLTLDEMSSSDLCQWINSKKKQFGLHLENLGILPYDQVKQLYTQVQALIFPSTLESFGLPLIEARQAGLPVLASELDYVRDVVDPEQSFDPESPLSIARAVKRFIGSNSEPLPLLDAVDFIRNIF